MTMGTSLDGKRILLLTNMCPHYRVHLFEYLSAHLRITYLFFSDGSDQQYWEKKNTLYNRRFAKSQLRSVRLGKKLRLPWDLFLRLLFGRYDILVVSNIGALELPIAFFVGLLRRKKIILWSGLWSSKERAAVGNWIRLQAYRLADAIICYGIHVGDYLKSLGIPGEKLFMGWQTLDNNQYAITVDSAAKAKSKDSIGAEKHIVLYVGRLHRQKGVDVLVEAFEILRHPDTVLVIVGDGPERKNLERSCSQKDLNVRFEGYVGYPDLATYYAIATVLVIPSIRTDDFLEPWAWVANEAMNQGCPVIATDAVGASAGGLVENNRTGIIVPAGVCRDLADAIGKVVNSAGFRETLSANAREKIETWDTEFGATGFMDALKHVAAK